MTLSRWRRVATGIAAGVIVMCAALLGASMRSDTAGVSIAQESRVANAIPIPVETDEADSSDEVATADDSTTEDTAPDSDATEAAENAESAAPDSSSSDDTSPTGDTPAQDDGTATIATDEPDTSDADTSDETAGDDTTSDPVRVIDEPVTADEPPADEPATEAPAAEEAPAAPAQPLTGTADALGTGGGVDDAECAIDRLVIYAGARRGGVAGSIRAALAQAGFGAGCPTPVAVLASNCPQQFAGVLRDGSGYDPSKSYIASSANVDRETMTSVMDQVGYSGNAIDILDFGFVNPDKPGESWVAIFIPNTFTGWETLASRAGLAPTTASLCAPSGELAG